MPHVPVSSSLLTCPVYATHLRRSRIATHVQRPLQKPSADVAQVSHGTPIRKLLLPRVIGHVARCNQLRQKVAASSVLAWRPASDVALQQ